MNIIIYIRSDNMKEYNESNNCICDILKKICLLQKKIDKPHELDDCAKKELGRTEENCLLFTRPIMLFCCDNTLFNVKIDDTYSSLFRVEKITDCCAVLRILICIPSSPLNNHNLSIITTDNFITINTKCFCAIKCLNDVYLDNTIVINNYILYKNDQIIDQDSFEYGTHFFRTVDPNNDEQNPIYRIDISLRDLTKNYPLNLINNIVVSNPHFIILNVNLDTSTVPNILSITFQIQTENLPDKTIIDDVIEESLFSFEIGNDNSLIEQFAFLITIISIYP